MHQKAPGLLLLLFFFCLPFTLAAQEPYMRWYTIDNGLSSSQIYQVLQDRKGFLWCCTGNGISVFDGTHFHTFSAADGFPDRGAFHMIEDSSGKIWFLTFNGKTCYYENNRFYPLKLSLSKDDYVRWIIEGPDKRMYFLTNNGYVVIQQAGQKNRFLYVCGGPLIYGILLHPDTLLITANNVYYTLSISSGAVRMLPFPPSLTCRYVRSFSLTKDKALLSCDNGFYAYDRGVYTPVRFKPGLVTEPVCCLREENNDTWIGTTGGVLFFKGGILDEAHLERFLLGRSVTSILKDYEGNYWFSASNEGMCMMPKQYASVYDQGNGLASAQQILCVTADQSGKVYAFSTKQEVYRLDSNAAVFIRRLNTNLPAAALIKALPLSDEMLLSTDGEYWKMEQDSFYKVPLALNLALEYSAPAAVRHDTLVFTLFTKKDFSIYEYTFPGHVKTKCWTAPLSDTLKNFFVTAITGRDAMGNFWLGTRQNLLCLEPGGKIWRAGNDIPELATSINDLTYDAAGNLWIATATNGVICMRGKKVIARYNPSTHLPGNCCNSLLYDDHKIWACTNGGLACIRPGEASPVSVYSCPGMLPERETLSMCKSGSRLYVVTTKGIGVFDESFLQPLPLAPPVYISRVNIAGHDTTLQAAFRLDHAQNNISLSFSAIAFRNPGEINYRYRLDGIDTAWMSTSSEHIQYSALPPGAYTFCVYAQNASGLLSKIPAVISFTILPAWWQTWWFRVPAVLLCAGILFVLISIRIRNIRKAAENRRMILETKLQALRAQINPHFVFNALNSVQSFIFTQHPEQANEYLVHFARLMRMIAEYSVSDTILLREEIHFLEHYIALEKSRFDGEFISSIEADATLDPDVCRIPPMILQPFIENAFKHGFPGKEGKKILRVRFSGSEAMLKVLIEDNGTGRQKEKITDGQIKYEALGISNIRQRLLLLHRAKSKTDPVQLTDLYDENGNPAGLRVELTIYLPGKKQ